MHNILGVRFREVGKIHYFAWQSNNILKGDTIIAETKTGVEAGTVMTVLNAQNFSGNILPSEKIIRKATDDDMKSLENKKSEEAEAGKVCKKKIAEHKLKMKLIDVEYMFNRGKIIFYFVSESRVDFRGLVKELAHIFKTRIELRQVGIRDEAKMLGGLGMCGKPFCCATFLNDFQPVSIKMAKDQGMSLNPTKLSGTCGRLMCCLKYEEEAYRDIMRRMPAVGSSVITPEGKGRVVSQKIIAETINVNLSKDAENLCPKAFKIDEIKVLSE